MKDRREKWTRVRFRIIGVLFTLFFAITSARAFYLQVVQQDQLIKIAERQHQKIVPLTPDRGTIFDRTSAPLAVSIEMDSCYAAPREMENVHEAAAKLAPLLGMPREALEAKLGGNKGFVWLQRRLPPEQVKQIQELEIDGIGFVKESKRFYPNAEIASHVIGFTGVDPTGLEGIELKYDSTILGNAGYLVAERDALGREIARKGIVVTKASKGHNVMLTLDKNIQYIAEKELAKAVDSSRAKGGMAVVMEPQTGRVLALANYPSFNPNVSTRYPSQVLRNRAISDSFEPGSTFKVFLIAGALEEGVISPNDGFNCEGGSYSIGGRTIHDTHSYGRLSVGEILKYSSNIGAAKIGSRLGAERLNRYLRNFGFGDRTGVDLPGEASGLLRDKKQLFAVDLATVSFGQGVSATALQIATAVSAVANGGILYKPQMVEQIINESGTVLQQFAPQSVRRVISPETARIVTGMMEGVAAEGGTGTNAAVDGYRVAGKTGTAQKVDPITHGYSVDKRTASFVGFVPADNPKLTILVIVDEPKTSPYGGVVAAPAFGAIAHQSLCYLNVPPNQPTRHAKAKEPATQPVTVAVPAAAEGTIDNLDGGMTMPNLHGMSMRQVLQTMEKRKINIKMLGSGRAVEQNPAGGARIGPTDQVWVRFVPAA